MHHTVYIEYADNEPNLTFLVFSFQHFWKQLSAFWPSTWRHCFIIKQFEMEGSSNFISAALLDHKTCSRKNTTIKIKSIIEPMNHVPSDGVDRDPRSPIRTAIHFTVDRIGSRSICQKPGSDRIGSTIFPHQIRSKHLPKAHSNLILQQCQ